MSFFFKNPPDARFPEAFYDLRLLLRYIHKQLGLPKPTWLQEDMAHFIQCGPDDTVPPWEPPNDRIFVGGYRGIGKSHILSIFFDQMLGADQSLSLQTVSGAKDRADDFTTFCQRLIMEVPCFAHLVPRKPERWSKISFDVEGAPAKHAPSVKARSITGMLVGSRANLIGADDIETPQNSDTQLQREKIETLASEFENIMLPGGRTVYLGTYQSMDSIYFKLPDKGFSCRLYPGRFPRLDEIDEYEGMLAPCIEEHLKANPGIATRPTDPTRFDDETLLAREASMGRSMFQLQFMLNPGARDKEKYPLKTSDLIVMDTNDERAPEHIVWASGKDQVIEIPSSAFRGDHFHKPMQVVGDWVPYTGSAIHVDPSGRGKDDTTWCVTKVLNGMIFLLELGASLDGYEPHVLEDIALCAAKHRVNVLGYEDNMGDGMFGHLINPVLRSVYKTKKGTGCLSYGVRNNVRKEKRIVNTLEPIMNSHRLIVNKKALEWDASRTKEADRKFIFQLTRMQDVPGALVHDDLVDVVAQAVDYWNEQGILGQDFRQTMEERRSRSFVIDDDFEDSTPTWVSGMAGMTLHSERKL